MNNDTTSTTASKKIPEFLEGLYKDSSFLSNLRNGAHQVHEVEFEGQTLAMRLLTVKEQRETSMKARKRWMAIPELVRLPTMNFHYEILEILTLALTIKEAGQRISEAELEALIEGQFLNLFHIYEDLEAKYNVSLDYILEDDRYHELLDDLQKKKVITNSISRYELEALSRRLLSETDQLMDKLRTYSSAKPTTTI